MSPHFAKHPLRIENHRCKPRQTFLVVCLRALVQYLLSMTWSSSADNTKSGEVLNNFRSKKRAPNFQQFGNKPTSKAGSKGKNYWAVPTRLHPWSICWRAGLSLGFSMPNSRPDCERCQEMGQPDSPCLTPAESLSPEKADRHHRWVSAALGLMLNPEQLKKHQWFMSFLAISLACVVRKKPPSQPEATEKSVWVRWETKGKYLQAWMMFEWMAQ